MRAHSIRYLIKIQLIVYTILYPISCILIYLVYKINTFIIINYQYLAIISIIPQIFSYCFRRLSNSLWHIFFFLLRFI